MKTISQMMSVSTILALILASLILVVLPAGYFVLGYQDQKAVIETEAYMNAMFLSQAIGESPEYWQFEHHRLAEVLASHTSKRYNEQRSIFDANNAVVARSGARVVAPFLRVSHNLYDSGNVVGRIEITSSLRPLLKNTLLAGIFGLLFGSAVFATLRLFPLRALAKAMQSVYEEKEKAQASEQKLKNRNAAVGRLNNALVALSKNEKIYKDGIDTAFMAITETSAHAMDVSRVSIWFYTEGNKAIKCRDLYEMNSGAHSEGLVLEAAACPAYFSAMQEEYSIAADNAVEDPRTKEFSEAYLKPLGITSMLDVPIRVAGKVVGVVCHEHVGAMRKWTIEEQSFVTAIAGFISVAIESHERIRGDEEIRKLNRELELKVEERTKQLLEAREELVRKEKLSILGQLAGSVGHELRNPLGVMNNAIYFLKTVLPESDKPVHEYLNMIKSEIDNSERIISDLLDFSRTKTPQKKSVAVNELITLGLEKCTVPENVKIERNIPDSLPLLKVDPFQMAQVFQNLMTNAYQAMPEGGVLRISARRGARGKGQGARENIEAGQVPRVKESQKEKTTCPYPDGPSLAPCYLTLDPDKDFIEISVTDTGEGISPENMKKLFQPLFTTKTKGIGLGLIVCRNLTGANGGRLEVESELGQGTVFKVALPVAAKEVVNG